MIPPSPRKGHRTEALKGLFLRGLSAGILLWTVSAAWGSCPQPRHTQKAPPDVYNRTHPLDSDPETILAVLAQGLHDRFCRRKR